MGPGTERGCGIFLLRDAGQGLRLISLALRGIRVTENDPQVSLA